MENTRERYLSNCATLKVWWRRNDAMELFFWSFVQVNETLNASAYKDILANCMQFEEDKFSLHRDRTLVHKQGP